MVRSQPQNECGNADEVIDNLRRKMFDADIIMMLLSNLEDEDEFVRQSAAYSIGALAKHGTSCTSHGY